MYGTWRRPLPTAYDTLLQTTLGYDTKLPETDNLDATYQDLHRLVDDLMPQGGAATSSITADQLRDLTMMTYTLVSGEFDQAETGEIQDVIGDMTQYRGHDPNDPEPKSAEIADQTQEYMDDQKLVATTITQFLDGTIDRQTANRRLQDRLLDFLLTTPLKDKTQISPHTKDTLPTMAWILRDLELQMFGSQDGTVTLQAQQLFALREALQVMQDTVYAHDRDQEAFPNDRISIRAAEKAVAFTESNSRDQYEVFVLVSLLAGLSHLLDRPYVQGTTDAVRALANAALNDFVPEQKYVGEVF